MASIFRPTYTATDPKTGEKIRKRSKMWWIRYYAPDGVRHRVKGYKDKKATETYAAELERKAIRNDAGLTDPSDEHGKRPLAEHAEDFRRYLAAKGNTPSYVKKALFRLQAVLDECRFVRMADLSPSAVVELMAHLRTSKGKSLKTANEYLAVAKGFTRWLWRDRRMSVDPLASLSKLAGTSADVVHARRDFTGDELRWLFNTAQASGKTFRGLDGMARYTLYLTAAATGFRTSELASMTPDSFDLDGDTPTATVRAACTKNGREAVQPLPVDVATIMAEYLKDKPSGESVWPGKWADDSSAKMIYRDMTEARSAYLQSFQNARQRDEAEQGGFLARTNGEGRKLDFHSLRHGYITMIGKTGVSAREHMDLARHSSYAMTARYSHSRAYDLAAAVQTLPIPTAGPNAERQEMKATGTDGRTHQRPLMDDCPNLVPQPAILGDFLRRTETEKATAGQTKNPGKQAFAAVFPGDHEKDEKRRGGDSNPR